MSINLYMYNGIQSNNTTYIHLIDKIVNIIKEHNVNILMFQEDIESRINETHGLLTTHGTGFNAKPFYCRAEKYNEKQLVNTIYIHDNIVSLPLLPKYESTINQKCKDKKGDVERCFVGKEIQIQNTEIFVLTTHLCGGKFSDEKFREITNEKDLEIGKIFDYLQASDIYPTIFSADFNSIHPKKFNESNIPKYMKDIISTLKDDEKSIALEEAKQYLTSGHHALEQFGMTCAFPQSNVTSNFGTMVDYIYYDNNK